MKPGPQHFVCLAALIAFSLPAFATPPPQGKSDSGIGTPTAASFPFAELGTRATADYQGDAMGILSTAEGAGLRTGFQKLAGTVTREGLTLHSTSEQAGRLHLIASAIGRAGSPAADFHSLPSTGRVSRTETLVTFSRPGLTEEYSVSVDGVRQDFIVAAAPVGEGPLRVELSLAGATAEAAAEGTKLTLKGSARTLAYSRLKVTDARGQVLGASLHVITPSRLAVQVADGLAVYPIRIDPTFSDADWVSMNPGIAGPDSGDIAAIAVDGGGNLYIGGSFSFAGTVPVNGIAKWDGNQWSALGAGVDGSVSALAANGNDLYVAGNFVQAGGKPARLIAKWNGKDWSALGSGFSNGEGVSCLAVNGTDLYVGGSFANAGGVKAGNIAKWNGSAWSALGLGIDQSPSALAFIGRDLYAGGSFTKAGGIAAQRIAKWNGNTWSALGLGLNDSVRALAVSGGDLYAGGQFTTAGGTAVNHIAMWNGSAWLPLDSGIGGHVQALAVMGSDLYAGGEFFTAGGKPVNRFAKWDGNSWSPAGSGMNGAIYRMTAIGGTLYAGGQFTMAGGTHVNRIAKSNGTDWSALGLGSGMNGQVTTVVVSGNDLYVGGTFTSVGGKAANCVVKWDGSTWSALGSGLTGPDSPVGTYHASVQAMAVSGGDLYAAGHFAFAGGVEAHNIAKWNGNGWSALSSGLTGPYGDLYSEWDVVVVALAVKGSDLYAGGLFSRAGGVPVNNVAKWNGSGWSGLGAGLIPGPDSEFITIRALAVSGGELYAGGSFSTAGGSSVNNIAKWNGSQWKTLASGISGGWVNALAVSGSDIYVGGVFAMAGGIPVKNIARWNGIRWSALGAGFADGPVNALAVNGSYLYAGGGSTMPSDRTARNIAKWNGSEWSPLGSGVNGEVTSLAVAGTNRLFVGGDFSFAGTTVSPHLAQAKIGVDKPTVTAISPAQGSSSGGTSVTLTGTGFTGATSLTIGGMAASDITVVNDQTLTATTPLNNAGSASVVVTNPCGPNAANALYLYIGQTSFTAWAAANNASANDSTVADFAFGTLPGVTRPLGYGGNGIITATGQPIADIESTTSGKTTRILFVRRKDFVSVMLTYVPQFSADLTSWHETAATPRVLADDTVNQICSLNFPILTDGRQARYFRMGVSISP